MAPQPFDSAARDVAAPQSTTHSRTASTSKPKCLEKRTTNVGCLFMMSTVVSNWSSWSRTRPQGRIPFEENKPGSCTHREVNAKR